MSFVVILAGGRSKRAGGNKPLLLLDKKPLIEHVLDAIEPQARRLSINVAYAQTGLNRVLMTYGLGLIYDEPGLDDLGPLSGVYAALKSAHEAAYVITVPCDMPYIVPDYVEKLEAAHRAHPDRIVLFATDRPHPLCALWPKNVLFALKDALEAGRKTGGVAVMDFLKTQAVHVIADRRAEAFVNINAPTPVEARPKSQA